jgi:protein-tyrosine phosphatase
MDSNKSSSEFHFKSLLNFRDIGGISVPGDKKIRNGFIFRSANPDTISRSDIKKLQQLKIKTIIDLRAPSEQKKKRVTIDHADTISLPLDFQQKTRDRMMPYFRKKNSEEIISDISNALYLEMADATLDIIGDVFEVLLSEERTPVLIHCQAGKDRTGIVSALILLALGADRQFIIDDFMRSNVALIPYFRRKFLRRKILSLGYFPARNVMFAVTVRQRNIESVIDRVSVNYGGIEGFLKGSGFDVSRLKELRERIVI